MTLERELTSSDRELRTLVLKSTCVFTWKGVLAELMTDQQTHQPTLINASLALTYHPIPNLSFKPIRPISDKGDWNVVQPPPKLAGICYMFLDQCRSSGRSLGGELIVGPMVT